MWLALLACAPQISAPAVGPDGLRSEVVMEGAIPARLAKEPADLVILYGGEQHGTLETCGCPKRPKGSISRLATYVDAARTDASVLVHGGYFLSDLTNADLSLRGDVALMNIWMERGMAELPWDAVNVAENDLVGLTTTKLPLVSLNLAGPGISPWLIVQRGGQRIGLTGISATGVAFTVPEEYAEVPPQSVGPRLKELASQVDVLVLMAYAAPEAARILRAQVPEIDVILDVGQHRELLQPVRVGRSIWAFSPYETWRVGELRLHLADGQVTDAPDRKIDLDPEVPSRPDLLAMQKQARAELDVVQAKLFGP